MTPEELIVYFKQVINKQEQREQCILSDYVCLRDRLAIRYGLRRDISTLYTWTLGDNSISYYLNYGISL